MRRQQAQARQPQWQPQPQPQAQPAQARVSVDQHGRPLRVTVHASSNITVTFDRYAASSPPLVHTPSPHTAARAISLARSHTCAALGRSAGASLVQSAMSPLRRAST